VLREERRRFFANSNFLFASSSSRSSRRISARIASGESPTAARAALVASFFCRFVLPAFFIQP
jgi:hypothetical protein